MGVDVYLHGKPVGRLRPGDDGYEFAYAREALEPAGDGEGHSSAQLSRSLPLRAEPFAHEEVCAYVEGLLPAGARREQIAAELGLDPADGYGLIAALGRDCPGAVVFLPEGAPPPRRPDPGAIAWAWTPTRSSRPARSSAAAWSVSATKCSTCARPTRSEQVAERPSTAEQWGSTSSETGLSGRL